MKISSYDLLQSKKNRSPSSPTKPWTFVTCYDHWTAKILNEIEGLDAILVGDSLAMVVHGFPSTVHATVEMMALHTAAVARGAPRPFLVSDFPFLSTQGSLDSALETARKLMAAGAEALKLEGTVGHLDLISRLTANGVPIMGHIGLTPQSVNTLGGYKVQGRTDTQAQSLRTQAKQLEEAGCFAIVLECVPKNLARSITEELQIPTIGIGAGPHCDGQILVLQDLLGFRGANKKYKFVREYLQGPEIFSQAVSEYVQSVKEGQFPNPESESF